MRFTFKGISISATHNNHSLLKSAKILQKLQIAGLIQYKSHVIVFIKTDLNTIKLYNSFLSSSELFISVDMF